MRSILFPPLTYYEPGVMGARSRAATSTTTQHYLMAGLGAIGELFGECVGDTEPQQWRPAPPTSGDCHLRLVTSDDPDNAA